MRVLINQVPAQGTTWGFPDDMGVPGAVEDRDPSPSSGRASLRVPPTAQGFQSQPFRWYWRHHIEGPNATALGGLSVSPPRFCGDLHGVAIVDTRHFCIDDDQERFPLIAGDIDNAF